MYKFVYVCVQGTPSPACIKIIAAPGGFGGLRDVFMMCKKKTELQAGGGSPRLFLSVSVEEIIKIMFHNSQETSVTYQFS